MTTKQITNKNNLQLFCNIMNGNVNFEYNIVEQIAMLSNCQKASELLEIKTILCELQDISRVGLILYNRKMNHFITNNIL